MGSKQTNDPLAYRCTPHIIELTTNHDRRWCGGRGSGIRLRENEQKTCQDQVNFVLEPLGRCYRARPIFLLSKIGGHILEKQISVSDC